MPMGKRKRHAKQASMWVAAQDLARSAAHPFYARLNQILDQHDFDGFVGGPCERFYADEGRPGLPSGRYFRLLLIGFERLDAERATAWRAADLFALREFLGLMLPEAPPDHSTISRTRRLIDLETHEADATILMIRRGVISKHSRAQNVAIGRELPSRVGRRRRADNSDQVARGRATVDVGLNHSTDVMRALEGHAEVIND